MVFFFDGEWFAYKRNGLDLIGIYPSRQLAAAAFLAWEA